MKTQFKIIGLYFFLALNISSVLKAEEMELPVINKPTILLEGTQTELTQAQIDELLPWAKDTKLFLDDLLDNISSLSSVDKIERLTSGIKQAIGESSQKNSELLMRYVLNRSLVLNDILNSELNTEDVGANDIKLKVLISSIKMALKYYDVDMATLSKNRTSPLAAFGSDYFNFLLDINKSVIDASAQYTIMRLGLEFFQWDLYRDLNNKVYAGRIVKINNSLKVFPEHAPSDVKSLALLKQMKNLVVQLKIDEIKIARFGFLNSSRYLLKASCFNEDVRMAYVLETAEVEIIDPTLVSIDRVIPNQILIRLIKNGKGKIDFPAKDGCTGYVTNTSVTIR